MAIYLIVLDRPNKEVWGKVESDWPAPNHHIHDDRVALVLDNTLLTSDVSEKIGIGSEASGVVSQMDFYSGHTSRRLVEWLKKTQI